ncbi:MAG: thermopsin, partial [Thermoplasmata archaeon]
MRRLPVGRIEPAAAGHRGGGGYGRLMGTAGHPRSQAARPLPSMVSKLAQVVLLSSLLLLATQPTLAAASAAPSLAAPSTTAPAHPAFTGLSPDHAGAPAGGPVPLTPAPPRSAPARPAAGPVDPYAIYAAEPAPMGIADYGLSGNGTPYDYATPGLQGIANISALGVLNRSTQSNLVTFELNGNVALSGGGRSYVYWAQSIAELNTSSGYIVFFDALWNESGPGATLAPASVSGNGTVDTSSIQRDEYTDTAGPGYAGSFASFPMPGPLGLELWTMNSSSGAPQITFGFRVGGGWVPYDTVTFRLPGAPRSQGFIVDGRSYTPATTFFDAELVLAGPSGSGSTGLVTSQMTLALDYWGGHNYVPVPVGWNFGSDSSGTVTNALSSAQIDPTTGFVGAHLGSGAGLLGPLYNASAVGTIVVTEGLPNGTVEVDGSDAGPFVGSPLLLLAPPGPLNVTLSNNGFVFGSGSVIVLAGRTVTMAVATRAYAVLEFRSVGLPAGIPWSVTVQTVTDATTLTNLSFPVPAGPYDYVVNPSPGYRVVPGGGSVTAVPPEVNVTLQWTGALFSVFFNETGLPLPTNWSVTLAYLGETVMTSNSQTEVIGAAPPGNFSFVVSTRAPYAPDPARGTGTVTDRPVAFTVHFTIENGTVEGTVVPHTATVEIGSAPVALNGSGGYRLVVPPGSYQF